MDLEGLSEFFSFYSLPSVIIAFSIAGICAIIDKFFLKNVRYNIRAYLPFLLGILLYALYDVIFIGSNPVFNEMTVSAGLMAGSLSSIIFAVIKKIVTGKGVKSAISPLALLIESIILPLVSENKLESAVFAIEKLLRDLSDDDGESKQRVTEEIATVISRHSNENTTEADCINSAKLIVTGKSNLGKN